jgi:hypothetical protein
MKVLDLVSLFQEKHVLGTKIRLHNVEINIAVYNSKLRIIRFSPYWKINGSLSSFFACIHRQGSALYLHDKNLKAL